MRNKFIGDRAFYRSVFAIALPIIIQNGITNAASLLDNLMVGQLGMAQMSGVSVVNQFIFIYTLALVGATSGPGIFTAQFFGSRDHEGIRYTFRFKAIACLIMGILGVCALQFYGTPLINTFLQGEGTAQAKEATLGYGLEYISVMLWGMIPLAIYFAYSSTLRECGQATIPMIASTSAVLLNLVLNYLLIFGKFGAPALGIKGAAIATVISRYVEMLVVVLWTHTHSAKQPFIKGAFRSLQIPRELLGKIIVRGSPLMVNEFLWAFGITFLNQCYSTRGLDVVSATSITTTIANLTNVVNLALGLTIGIILGQMLGAQRPEQEIRDANRRLTFLAVAAGVVFGGVLAATALPFPKLYKASGQVHLLATQLMLVMAATKPMDTYMFAAYYTLRSGGKTWTTFFYDSGALWIVTAPLIYLLSNYTQLPIVPLYAMSFVPNLLKCFVAYFLIRKGSWIQNLTK